MFQKTSRQAAHLTQEPGVAGSICGPATYFLKFVSPSAEFISLPRNSVFRLTDRPDMAIDIHRGRKATTPQQQHNRSYFYNDAAGVTYRISTLSAVFIQRKTCTCGSIHRPRGAREMFRFARAGLSTG